MEAVNGRVAARAGRDAWAARCTGPLLIVLVSAACGLVIGVVTSTARIAP
ncbi:hypothetical protein ACFSL4_03170 [Streptomyces caeni]|uniref:Uncharacterized protein n=1 Tax=Streptomyces caeni TaxID=2307231 RepID=A0ABW4IIV0_9ACTN